MDEKIRRDIAAYGWTILAVEETDYLPCFAFTLGLWEQYRQPELICFGLPVQTLQHTLNMAGELVKDGQILDPGKSYDDFFERSHACFLQVHPDNLGDYFAYALDYYGQDQIPALQLVWQDRNGRFPWEEQFEQEFRYRQPLLDRNMDFKFSESPELTVRTTRQFLENKAPLQKVVHDQEGSWHFLTPETGAGDIRIVSLKQVLQLEPSLNQFFNLDLGEQAVRSKPDAGWERETL